MVLLIRIRDKLAKSGIHKRCSKRKDLPTSQNMLTYFQAAVASLLPEHPGPDLCGGQQRQREDTGGTGRATENGNKEMAAKSSDLDPNNK